MLVKKDGFKIEEPFDHLALESFSIFAIIVSEVCSFQRQQLSYRFSTTKNAARCEGSRASVLKTYSVKAQLIVCMYSWTFLAKRVCGSHLQSYNTY